MSPALILGLCLTVQAAAIAVDEFYFHFKRGLPKWERIGHPLDTLSVLIVFLALNFTRYNGTTPVWLIGLMLFSCALITKDEWVHHEHCEAAESWLHSVLFLIHPLVFLASWNVWKDSGSHFLLQAQLAGLALFLLYQIIYWNFIAANGVPLAKRSQ